MEIRLTKRRGCGTDLEDFRFGPGTGRTRWSGRVLRVVVEIGRRGFIAPPGQQRTERTNGVPVLDTAGGGGVSTQKTANRERYPAGRRRSGGPRAGKGGTQRSP